MPTRKSHTSLEEYIDLKLLDKKLSLFFKEITPILNAKWQAITHNNFLDLSEKRIKIIELREHNAQTIVSKVYEYCCDLLEMKSRKKTPEFLRTVLSEAIAPRISALEDQAKQEVAVWIQGSGGGAERAVLFEIVEHKMNEVRAEWRDKLEIEAAECENADTPMMAKPKKSVIGANINKLRKECGWSFNDIAERTGLDKKLILGHINRDKPILAYIVFNGILVVLLASAAARRSCT